MKKITVKEFVDKYTKNQSQNLKAEMLSKIVSKKYAPLKEKASISREIIKKSLVKKDGIYQKSSVALYLNYILGMLLIYCPDLQLNPNDNFEDYDLLQSSGVLHQIMDEIGKDLEEYSTIYNMEVDDLFSNQFSTESFISGQISRLGVLIGTACNGGMNALSETLGNLKDEDLKKFSNILSSITKK